MEQRKHVLHWEKGEQMDKKLKLMEVLHNNFQNVSAQHVETLCKNANGLSRLNVKQCNEPFTRADERRESRLEEEIKAICFELHIAFVFTYEPMTYALFIHLPDETRNGYWEDEQHGNMWYGVGK